MKKAMILTLASLFVSAVLVGAGQNIAEFEPHPPWTIKATDVADQIPTPPWTAPTA